MKKLHENLTPEEKNSLKGHRERLRKRYLTQDNDYMDNNRLLELLLTYAIPRQDVYMLANSLIAKFGGIDAVLDASTDELMLVDGIGETAAILISLVSALNRKKMLAEITSKTFRDTDELARDICKLFHGSKEEKIIAVTLNNSMRISSHDVISSGTPEECFIDNRKLARLILKDNVSNVVIAHNHPSGNITPSPEDLHAISHLGNFLNSMSVSLIDMLIVSGDSYFRVSEAKKFADNISEALGDDRSYIYSGLVSGESNEIASNILEKRNIEKRNILI